MTGIVPPDEGGRFGYNVTAWERDSGWPVPCFGGQVGDLASLGLRLLSLLLPPGAGVLTDA